MKNLKHHPMLFHALESILNLIPYYRKKRELEESKAQDNANNEYWNEVTKNLR